VYSPSRFLLELAHPAKRIFLRHGKDTDRDGYSDRIEKRAGTSPTDPFRHPEPELVAGYIKKSEPVKDKPGYSRVELSVVMQNIGDFEASHVHGVLLSKTAGIMEVKDNLIGRSGRLLPDNKPFEILMDRMAFIVPDSMAAGINPELLIQYVSPSGPKRFKTSVALTNAPTDLSLYRSAMTIAPAISSITTADSWEYAFENSLQIQAKAGAGEAVFGAKLHVICAYLQGQLLRHSEHPLDLRPGLADPVIRTAYRPLEVLSASRIGQQIKVIVVLTDSDGTYLDSAVKRITVTAPVISSDLGPGPITEFGGSQLRLFLQGPVQGVIGYQWLLNSNAIPGATTPELLLTNVNLSNSGLYQLVLLGQTVNRPSAMFGLHVLERLLVEVDRGQAGTGVCIRAKGQPNTWLRLEASTDLKNWTQVLEGYSASGSLETNLVAPLVPCEFYRAATVQVGPAYEPALPQVRWIQPASDSEFAEWPAKVPIALKVTNEGFFGIDRIEVYGHGIRLVELTAAPYELVWTNPPTGTLCLLAKVTDKTGRTGYSEPRFVRIIAKPPPIIIQGPVGTERWMGDKAEFVVVAEGTPPLSYQWYFNGKALYDDDRVTGSTESVLRISGVCPEDAGNYFVRVWNNDGFVNSRTVQLLASAPPNFVWIPPGTFTMGSPASKVGTTMKGRRRR
jgi:hypothetical protein